MNTCHEHEVLNFDHVFKMCRGILANCFDLDDVRF